MKKYLIAFLLSLSCVFTIAAVGCNDDTSELSSTGSSVEEDSSDDSSGDSSDGEVEYTGNSVVSFTAGEGFTYTTKTKNNSEVANGSYVNFTVDLNGFYLDSNPVVYVNDKPVPHNGKGEYSVLITEKTTIRVTNVKRDISRMDGSGTMDSPFIVRKPIDLLYIAEKVNEGNLKYCQGAYVLANDIDCHGAELKVIGDLSTDTSYFSGCFISNYDENGQMLYHKISNFTINSQNANYVGFFGAISAEPGVTSSGLIYGLHLDNFQINAGLYSHVGDSKTLAVGSLVGFGNGATLRCCLATNGEVNVSADTNYFSYAGGLIGYQQAMYYNGYGAFPSEVSYATVDVDVSVLDGMVIYGGGISGYTVTNHPYTAEASIHSSVSTGDVSGALCSGGIVGGLGQYNVVSNCYATGEIFAQSTQSVTTGGATSDVYYHAYAGGLVGYAENDSIVHDSFFNGGLTALAESGAAYQHTNGAVAGGDNANTASANSEKYLAINCKENLLPSALDTYTKTLGWGDYNWIFTKDKLPEVNYINSASTVQLSLTVKFVAPNATDKSVLVSGKTSMSSPYFDSSIESANLFTTMGNLLASGGLKTYYQADGNTYRSFGYFFDEACTQKVPYGYLPMKDITLYVGFEDVAKVANTYYFTTKNSNAPLKITLGLDGVATYSDGVTEQQAYYTYDGDRIIIEGARLARYFDGKIEIDENATGVVQDANFDMYRYDYYNFTGTVEGTQLKLYDGTYFTEDKPLVASTTQPQTTVYDEFKGSWAKSANIHKIYTFDGQGNWSYVYLSYNRSSGNNTATTEEEANGTYTLNGDGSISFTHKGINYVASFDSNGFLQIVNGNNVQTYYRSASYLGSWTANGVTLTLEGIQKDGTGRATVTYADGMVYRLVYEVSETANYVALYYPHDEYWKDLLFGYFTYDGAKHTLIATLYDYNNATTGYTQFHLTILDEYTGEWISDSPTLADAEFEFDGLGLYGFDGQAGKVTITDGDSTTVAEYSLNSKLEGFFYYKDVQYKVAYDEDTNTILLSAYGSSTLVRKDKFANVAFVDLEGNTYAFDGRSSIATGGTFTVNGEHTYTYEATSDSYLVYALNGTRVGTITETATNYVWTIDDGGKEVSRLIYVQNEFMGKWAMSGEFATFDIGPTDLKGNIQATFKGVRVTLSFLDPTTLTFNFRDGNMPRTYYVYIREDEPLNQKTLVLTEQQNLYGDYIVCTPVSEWFGTWVLNSSKDLSYKRSITLDGVISSYAFGTIKDSVKSTPQHEPTLYNFNVKESGTLMWSKEAFFGGTRYLYYRLVMLKPGDSGYEAALANRNAWVNEENQTVILRTEVDGLCLTEAKDEDDNEYFFDGLGNIEVNGTVAYTYEDSDVTYNGDSTATIIVKNNKDNKYYTLYLDYSNGSANGTVEIGDEVQKKA